MLEKIISHIAYKENYNDIIIWITISINVRLFWKKFKNKITSALSSIEDNIILLYDSK